MPTASDIMTADVRSVSPATTIAEASTTMRDRRVGALPVVGDDGRLVGILTDRDIVVNVLANGGGPDSTIETYGVREVFSVPPEADIDEIQALMREHQVRRVPVLDDGALVGVVSLADIARAADADALGRTTERICE
jgi:CBS domain-containing protein